MRKGNFSGKASLAQNVNGRLAGRRPVRFVRRFELSVAQKADTTNKKKPRKNQRKFIITSETDCLPTNTCQTKNKKISKAKKKLFFFFFFLDDNHQT
jgi:hypothetical protein